MSWSWNVTPHGTVSAAMPTRFVAFLFACLVFLVLCDEPIANAQDEHVLDQYGATPRPLPAENSAIATERRARRALRQAHRAARENRVSDAISSATTSISEWPGVRSLCFLGQLLRRHGELSESRDVLVAVRQSGLASGACEFELGRTFEALGRRAEAIEAYSRSRSRHSTRRGQLAAESALASLGVEQSNIQPQRAGSCSETSAETDEELVEVALAEGAQWALSSAPLGTVEVEPIDSQARFLSIHFSQTRLRGPATRGIAALRPSGSRRWWLCGLSESRSEGLSAGRDIEPEFVANRQITGSMHRVTQEGWDQAYVVSERLGEQTSRQVQVSGCHLDVDYSSNVNWVCSVSGTPECYGGIHQQIYLSMLEAPGAGEQVPEACIGGDRVGNYGRRLRILRRERVRVDSAYEDGLFDSCCPEWERGTPIHFRELRP